MFNCQTKRVIIALFIYPFQFHHVGFLFWARWSNICLFKRLRNPAQFPHSRRFLPHNLPPKTRTIFFFFPHPVRRPDWYFPGCNAVRFLLVGCLVEVADKKELLGLLLDFFGQTLHASWKQKRCFVMFALWLNDWVNERRIQTVCLWGKICMKFLHCFGAGMLFICNHNSLTFLRKSTVLPFIFLHCSNAKQILLH